MAIPMTLGDILDRAYDALGDVRANPRQFPRQRLVDLANEGCQVFRRFVEDKWIRTTQDLVADQATYTFPSQNIRAIRIAFEDCTLSPTTKQELPSFDTRWQQRRQPRPTKWTAQGQLHNEYRIYPEPTGATANQFTFQNDPQLVGATGGVDRGVVGEWDDGAGPISFVADPNVGGWNADHGTLMSVDTESFTSEWGEVTQVQGTGVGNLTLWLVTQPPDMVNDGDAVPIKNAFQISPLWYLLWGTYEEEGEHHNSVLAAFYRDEFKKHVERGRELASNPWPFQVQKLGDSHPRRERLPALPFAPTGLDDQGGTMNLGWPRRGYWD
jgi:hypothetical protein